MDPTQIVRGAIAGVIALITSLAVGWLPFGTQPSASANDDSVAISTVPSQSGGNCLLPPQAVEAAQQGTDVAGANEAGTEDAAADGAQTGGEAAADQNAQLDGCLPTADSQPGLPIQNGQSLPAEDQTITPGDQESQDSGTDNADKADQGGQDTSDNQNADDGGNTDPGGDTPKTPAPTTDTPTTVPTTAPPAATTPPPAPKPAPKAPTGVKSKDDRRAACKPPKFRWDEHADNPAYGGKDAGMCSAVPDAAAPAPPAPDTAPAAPEGLPKAPSLCKGPDPVGCGPTGAGPAQPPAPAPAPPAPNSISPEWQQKMECGKLPGHRIEDGQCVEDGSLF